jgi:hypothetical protein
MNLFKRLPIIIFNMISSNNFKCTKKNKNKKITINFNAYSFAKDKICFFIFRNRLNSKVKININKLFNEYLDIMQQYERNKIIDPHKIYHDLEKLFSNFDEINLKDQIIRVKELLNYILINRNYFKKSNYAMDALENKLIKLYYYNKNFKMFKYYYFLIFKVNNIKIETFNIEYFDNKNDVINNKYYEMLDFELDNISNQQIWCDIKYDLNFL